MEAADACRSLPGWEVELHMRACNTEAAVVQEEPAAGCAVQLFCA